LDLDTKGASFKIFCMLVFLGGNGLLTQIFNGIKERRRAELAQFAAMENADHVYTQIREAYQEKNWEEFRNAIGRFANEHSKPISPKYIDPVTSERFAESLRLAAEAGEIDNLLEEEKINSLSRLEAGKSHYLPECLFMLGYLHEHGLFGLPKNDAEAKRYYEQAIINGGIPGLFHLGMMYRKGGNSTPRNTKMANQLLQLACDKGHQPSCEVLSQ
jgi:TPR repeat protein